MCPPAALPSKISVWRGGMIHMREHHKSNIINDIINSI